MVCVFAYPNWCCYVSSVESMRKKAEMRQQVDIEDRGYFIDDLIEASKTKMGLDSTRFPLIGDISS